MIVKVSFRGVRKILSFSGSYEDFVTKARTKFRVPEGPEGLTVKFVDSKDGAEVEEDVFAEVVELGTELMMLVGDETWGTVPSTLPDTGSDADTDVISDDDSQDKELSSSRSAPPMKRLRTVGKVPQPNTTTEAVEKIKSILKKSSAGDRILEEYRHKSSLSDKTRRLLVSTVVAEMMKVHGRTPPGHVKTNYAIGIVNTFGSLKDPHTPTGHEAFYDERSNTGFLAAKIKNVNRGERLSSPSRSSPIVPRALDGEPKLARKVDTDGRSKDEDDADINWMKHTPASQANVPVVMEKMRATLPIRRELVNNETTAAVVIREFPQFQVTPGLIEQDFRLMFKDEYPKLLEGWPILSPKIIALARESTFEKEAVKQLLATVDKETDCFGYSDLASWDADTATFILLLCLLPPVNHGRKGSSKIPVKEAINFLVQFEKSGSSVDAFLEKNKQKKVAMQPYLLGLGESRKNITQYFIIIDHLALPCSAHDAVGAFDTLFKSHYVFGLHYSSYLQSFWTFLQTTVYHIDVQNTQQPPRVRELRSKIQLQE